MSILAYTLYFTKKTTLFYFTTHKNRAKDIKIKMSYLQL